MRKFTLRLIVAILTFLLGVTAVTVWFINRQSSKQNVRLVVPDAPWEKHFFTWLDEHAKGANLSNLRGVTFPEGDLEVRLWYDARPSSIDGVILRRSGNHWSATYLHGTYEHQPFRMEEKTLAAPKSGWEAAWGRLERAGILKLPDASEVQCYSVALDGIGYVVEARTNNIYRTYRYSNPQLMKCSEARQVLEIGEIMEEEFDMWNPKHRE